MYRGQRGHFSRTSTHDRPAYHLFPATKVMGEGALDVSG